MNLNYKLPFKWGHATHIGSFDWQVILEVSIPPPASASIEPATVVYCSYWQFFLSYSSILSLVIECSISILAIFMNRALLCNRKVQLPFFSILGSIISVNDSFRIRSADSPVATAICSAAWRCLLSLVWSDLMCLSYKDLVKLVMVVIELEEDVLVKKCEEARVVSTSW